MYHPSSAESTPKNSSRRREKGVNVRVVTVYTPENKEALEAFSRALQPTRNESLRLGIADYIVISLSSAATIIFVLLVARMLVLKIAPSTTLWSILALLFSVSWIALIAYPHVWIGLAILSHVLNCYILPHFAKNTCNWGLWFGLWLVTSNITVTVLGWYKILKRKRLTLKPKLLLQVVVMPSEKIVHSKIFIFDDHAIVGSANLTRSGLWRNIETIVIYSPNEIETILSQFEKIWWQSLKESLYILH